MRLIQFETAAGERRVGVVEGRRALEVQDASSVRVLALAAIEAGRDLTGEILARGQGEAHDYPALLREGRVLPPLDHEDPAHCLVTGTGLTHLGSAAARDAMHQALQQQAQAGTLTDSMRMFQWGVEGGIRRPAPPARSRNGSTRAMARSWSRPARTCPRRISPSTAARSRNWSGCT